MKRIVDKVISIMLCLAMCMSTIVPVFAANESNELDVEISAYLDREEMTVGDEDQTVTMTIKANKPVVVDGIGLRLTWSDQLALVSVSGGELITGFSASNYSTESGMVGWTADKNIDNVEVLIVATFKVPAGTAVGTYTVGAEGIELTSNMGEPWEETASASATLTITKPDEPTDPEPDEPTDEPTTPVRPVPTEGYAAQITTDVTSTTVESEITVNIYAAHVSEEAFHAAELILNYDDTKLELIKTGLVEGSYTDEDGKLTFEEYDKEHTLGQVVYTFTFKAIESGEAAITLTSAKFLHKDFADAHDLIEAEVSERTVTVNIKEVYTVTETEGSNLEGLTYPRNVTEGSDLEITAQDTNLYQYTVSATINGQPVNVTERDGTFIIEADDITGDIVLTTSRTGREFNAIWTGTGADDVVKPEGKPTYEVNYVFTVPAEQEATATDPGYIYSATVTIGSSYNATGASGQTITIPGTEITGDVTIEVTKTEIPATGKTVTITGSDVTFADGSTTAVVNPGEKLTLTLKPETGYAYSVKMGDEVIMTEANPTYELTVGDENINIVVTKTVKTDNLVSVNQYVTLNSQAGEKLWLVTFAPTLVEGKIPTYDGNNMFWSEKYQAYCYLVKAATLTVENAAEKLDAIMAETVAIDYTSYDVNGTGVLDTADAQFVANMYNAMYDIEDVDMKVFLSADLSTDVDMKLNMDDAAAIVSKILENAAN